MASLVTTPNRDATLYNEHKFVLAYYSSSDKCWYVQPRRFFLTEFPNRGIIIGQFIQSNWFNIVYKMSDRVIFVLLKVKQNCSINTIEKDMNSLKNPFPSLYDIPPYANRASYFAMPWDILRHCTKEANNKENIKFTLRANNNPWDKLTIQIYKHEMDSVTITLPEFEIPIH